MREYYEAYDERYKTIHARGCSWACEVPTPIVLETIRKYRLFAGTPMLEIGCGEGRDALAVLQGGYDLLAADVSDEAISYCRKIAPGFAQRFQVLDCLRDPLDHRFGFIYSVAVLHMLVLDPHRELFYRFIHDHLLHGGLALICSMGDGEKESSSDVSSAFCETMRSHPSGEIAVAQTSCRIVSMPHFLDEIRSAGLVVVEYGLTASPPEFDSLLYAVVRKD